MQALGPWSYTAYLIQHEIVIVSGMARKPQASEDNKTFFVKRVQLQIPFKVKMAFCYEGKANLMSEHFLHPRCGMQGYELDQPSASRKGRNATRVAFGTTSSDPHSHIATLGNVAVCSDLFVNGLTYPGLPAKDPTPLVQLMLPHQVNDFRSYW